MIITDSEYKALQVMAVLFTLLPLTLVAIHLSMPLLSTAESPKLGKNPEVDMNATELISSKGYPVESHTVVTKDGYILTLFRIPHGLHNKVQKGPRPTVLLQHGLVASCDDYLVNPANESLAYILADAGAEVWLGNNRGNVYSRKHNSLNPNKLDFWKFSWDEMAQYDLPATIYYILNQTGHDQLYYVGHSQGTAIGFARFSEDQALASKVKHFMALAPIARVTHMTSLPLQILVPFANEVEIFLDTFGHGEFDFPEPLHREVAEIVCENYGETLCENFIFLLCGYNPKSFNKSRSDVYLSHVPAGASALTLMQWVQGVKSGQFQHFDYGEKENVIKYGQKTPPLYDPRKVKVPVAIFRGGRDLLADITDVQWLLPQLNVTHDIIVPFYEHLDLTYAFDAATLVYKYIVNIVMEKD